MEKIVTLSKNRRYSKQLNQNLGLTSDLFSAICVYACMCVWGGGEGMILIFENVTENKAKICYSKGNKARSPTVFIVFCFLNYLMKPLYILLHTLLR